MKLEQSFTVEAPIDEVWAAMIDVERIAPCLPGAEISGADASGGYEGTFTVKLECENPTGRRTARYVVVGIDPLWVFRQEDFDKMAHWEMDMTHDEADAASPKERKP